MKKLNNTGIAHLSLLLVVVVAIVGVVGFKVVQQARAGTTRSTQVTCVLSAPNTVGANEGFDVNLYMTNSTGTSYTPLPVVSIQTYDANGTPTFVKAGQLHFQSVASQATGQLNLLKTGQWSLGDTDQKAVFTVRDTTSAASCTKTVLRS
jgi:hypothetical protein